MVAQKNLLAVLENQVQSLGLKGPLEKGLQLTPAFLPGESHGQRSLAGYSSWGCKESDTPERLALSLSMKRLPSARRVQVFIVYEARCSVSKPRQRWADTPCSRLGEEEAGADGSPQQQLPGHTAGREEGRARPGGRVARAGLSPSGNPRRDPPLLRPVSQQQKL